MSRVDSTHGYTIVETLIFLAVSGLLFASAAVLISGQQRKAEFQQGIRDFESQIQDIANDVSTGYYATNNDFSCIAGVSGAPPTTPSAAPGAADRGTNVGCILVGRAMHFSPSDATNAPNTFDIYPVVGNKQKNNQEVETLTDAQPTAIAKGVTKNLSSASSIKTRDQIPGGITVGWVKYTDASGTEQLAAGFGIFTTFGRLKSDGSGRLDGGTIYVNVLPVGAAVNQDPDVFVEAVDSINNSTVTNTKGDVKICLQSAGTKQHVILTLAGGNRKFGTETAFEEGDTCP